MGASVSLQGRFCHDMDPDSSILVSSLGYIEIDQSIELQWIVMDCCQRCTECQMHGDLIHVLPSELHALTLPWPFSVWGIDIILIILVT